MLCNHGDKISVMSDTELHCLTTGVLEGYRHTIRDQTERECVCVFYIIKTTGKIQLTQPY